MQKQHKKKSRLFRVIRGVSILVIGMYVYGMYIEPKLLVVRNLAIPVVHEALDGLKVVQITDTQLGDFYTVQALERVVRRVNSLEPDIVIFTGDLIDHMRFYEGDTTYIATQLKAIEAPYGKYAIYGNHDQGGGAHKVYPEIMEAAGFNLLVNEVWTLKFGETSFNLIGIDDYLLGYPQLEATLAKVQQEAYNVLLVHEPDVADSVARYPVDLQLSGHTHGGQVQIPFIGPIITPPMGYKYTDGLYTIGTRHKLYVNTGLGNTKMQFRFLNSPQIALITLEYELE